MILSTHRLSNKCNIVQINIWRSTRILSWALTSIKRSELDPTIDSVSSDKASVPLSSETLNNSDIQNSDKHSSLRIKI